MARYYTTRDFCRQMPNALLARYFESKAVLDEVDYPSLKETKPDALFSAWLALSDSQRHVMDSEFQTIHELSSEKGFRAILDEAEWHLVLRKFDDFALLHRVFASRQQVASLRVAFAGHRQGDLRVLPKGHQLLSPLKTVLPPPQPAAGRRHIEPKPPRITQAVCFVGRFGPFDFVSVSAIVFPSAKTKSTPSRKVRYPQIYPHQAVASIVRRWTVKDTKSPFYRGL